MLIQMLVVHLPANHITTLFVGIDHKVVLASTTKVVLASTTLASGVRLQGHQLHLTRSRQFVFGSLASVGPVVSLVPKYCWFLRALISQVCWPLTSNDLLTSFGSYVLIGLSVCSVGQAQQAVSSTSLLRPLTGEDTPPACQKGAAASGAEVERWRQLNCEAQAGSSGASPGSGTDAARYQPLWVHLWSASVGP